MEEEEEWEEEEEVNMTFLIPSCNISSANKDAAVKKAPWKSVTKESH